MESIDKLRDWARRVTESDPDENIVSPEYVAQECGRMALRFADEIEREVADRYMELPLDADGVPIHVGDWMRHCDFNVQCAAVSPERVYYWDEYKDGHWVMGVKCRHAKPRTIEDVLREFAQGVQGQNADFAELAARRYADEIRELAGTDD